MIKNNNIFLYYCKKASYNEQLSEPFQQNIINDWLFYLFSKNKNIKNWNVLDYGSGLGSNIKTLKKFFKQITAVDVNKKALEFSQKKYGKSISYRLLKNERLPFEEKTFDLILATEVFEHIPNIDESMKELKRVIKDKGFFILSCPNYFNLTGLIKKIKDSKLSRPMWGPWGGHDGGFERFTTWYFMEKMLFGFKILFKRGADYYYSWFYSNPAMPFRFRKYILLWPGKLPIIKKFGMNYFILSQKES